MSVKLISFSTFQFVTLPFAVERVFLFHAGRNTFLIQAHSLGSVLDCRENISHLFFNPQVHERTIPMPSARPCGFPFRKSLEQLSTLFLYLVCALANETHDCPLARRW